MESLIIILIIITILYGISQHLFKRKQVPQPQPTLPPEKENESKASETSEAPNELFQLAENLDEFNKHTAYPSDLLEHPDFQRGVKLLASPAYSVEELLSYATGANLVIGCLALEALSHRQEAHPNTLRNPLLSIINDYYYWKRYFLLRLLNARFKEPLIGTIILGIDDTWEDPIPLRSLKEFIRERMQQGEVPGFGNALNGIAEERLPFLEKFLNHLGEEVKKPLQTELQRWQQTRIDRAFLGSFGHFWEQDPEKSDKIWIEHEYLLKKVQELEAALLESSPRSLVLVGESGVGKTAIARALGWRLRQRGWTIFEAGAAELLAGQIYIGQLEERVQQLVRKIGAKRKVLWIVPNFHELAWAGTHRHNPSGILDMLFPYLEKRDIILLGETRPIPYERLIQTLPRLRSALDTHLIPPLSHNETLQLARQWGARLQALNGAGASTPIISEETLKETFQLTQQYLGDKAAPGNLLLFLELTWKRLSAGGAAPERITLDDLLVTLSQLTGLPLSILDERQGLDLNALRELFHKRVMGQPEAVDCLVERVAMIKAGLTDPNRPAGVFLFAGPTGTGKTEIAKTLAEFLFGSPRRMIRLDMSEFQSTDSLERILGGGERNTHKKSLCDLIRKQPFSVVLLDEFEKAHPNVWDVFLQVFDEGRLTDRLGNTADFRHAIIFMTTNLGGVIPRGAGIGFTGEEKVFTPQAVAKAIEQTFRKEFINRIDRVVVFQPLSRAVMREVLRKELNEALQRRGLRSRAWAVEFHDSALEFLLDKGFTADLGARPLKRAIERYLLSPLALTIVNHQFPEGDQFLFVRSNGREIEVEFVDPDAPDELHGQGAGAGAGGRRQATGQGSGVTGKQFRLEEIVLDSQGTLAEAEFLKAVYDRLAEHLQGQEWELKKAGALARTAAPEFWQSPERYAVLGLAEYMDRIEAGFATAGRLWERLVGSRPRERKQFSASLMKSLAHQLYLLEAALRDVADNRPPDAFLRIEAGRDAAIADHLNDKFARKLAQMYLSWAEMRRMRHKILEERDGYGKEPFSLMLAVSGYGAYGILEKETGLHVFEIPAGGKSDAEGMDTPKSFRRCKAHVEVVPQPPEPAGNEADALLKQARKEFAKVRDGKHLTIVRRYREEPSPLVRDSVKNWRSGRLDRVLGGDFDLMG